MENPKFGEDGRDVHAGADVKRECRSELDVNLSWIASAIDGPTSRASRARMENLVNRIIGSMTEGNAVLSIDFKHWSP